MPLFSFKTVNGDDQVLRVVDALKESATLDNGAASVTTSPTLIPITAGNRVALLIQNLGAVAIYVGKSTVSSSNGIKIEPGAAFSDVVTQANVYAIAASGTCDVRWLVELY